MLSRCRHVWLFLPKLLDTTNFEGTEAARSMLENVMLLASMEGKKNLAMKDAPLDVVSKSWVKLVIGVDDRFDRKKLCSLREPAFELAVERSRILNPFFGSNATQPPIRLNLGSRSSKSLTTRQTCPIIQLLIVWLKHLYMMCQPKAQLVLQRVSFNRFYAIFCINFNV